MRVVRTFPTQLYPVLYHIPDIITLLFSPTLWPSQQYDLTINHYLIDDLILQQLNGLFSDRLAEFLKSRLLTKSFSFHYVCKGNSYAEKELLRIELPHAFLYSFNFPQKQAFTEEKAAKFIGLYGQ